MIAPAISQYLSGCQSNCHVLQYPDHLWRFAVANLSCAGWRDEPEQQLYERAAAIFRERLQVHNILLKPSEHFFKAAKEPRIAVRLNATNRLDCAVPSPAADYDEFSVLRSLSTPVELIGTVRPFADRKASVGVGAGDVGVGVGMCVCVCRIWRASLLATRPRKCKRHARG